MTIFVGIAIGAVGGVIGLTETQMIIVYVGMVVLMAIEDRK